VDTPAVVVLVLLADLGMQDVLLVEVEISVVIS